MMNLRAGEGNRKSFQEFANSLKEEGYTLKFDSSAVGKSGATHHVDLLAEFPQGEKDSRPIVCVKGSGKNPVVELLTAFAIALDLGAQPCYVTEGFVDEELARQYGIIVVSADKPISSDKEAAPQTERRLAAIMLTDIVGYTALAQKNEELAMRLLAAHNDLLRRIFSEYNGREIKTMGDSFLVEFSSALQAVRCAVAIQQRMRERNERLPQEEKIELRLGIHVGEVISERGDIFGDAVNVSSRIQPLAQPGGICISQQAYDHIRNKVEYKLVKLGKQTLKNVILPIDVYRLVLPWEANGEEELTGSRKRIAVLPFDNLSSDPAEGYFADGITEELISTLSNIEGLRVISRTSVMVYKTEKKKMSEIGKELNVGSVVEGTIRKAGDRVKIAVQLIDVGTDEHLWSQSYERGLEDVFAVQSDIAKQVAAALEVKILSRERELIEKKPTLSTEAYTLYLQGRYFWNERSKESLLKAVEYFKLAISKDPLYALAYSGLSDCYSVLGDHGHMSPLEAFSISKEYAARAVQLDGSSPEAHTSLANASFQFDRDWGTSENEFRKAIELRTSYATAHHWYGIFLLRRDRPDEALAEALKAQELDPLSPQIATFCGIVYGALRKFELAEKQHERALGIDPDFVPAMLNLATVYASIGRGEEAVRIGLRICELSKRDPSSHEIMAFLYAFAGKGDEARRILAAVESEKGSRYVDNSSVVLAYIGLGEKEKAVDLIEEEYGNRASWLADLGYDAVYDSIRDEPRVQEILRKLGLE